MHKLAAILQRPNYPSCGSSAKSSHCMDSLNAIQVPGAAHVSKRTGSVSSAESSAGSSSSTLLGSSNSSCSTEPDLSHHSYLEVCINTGEYTKTLSEINLDHIRCDGQLFRRIRSEYVRLRSYRSRFWLLRPSGVHFVRVSIQIKTMFTQLTIASLQLKILSGSASCRSRSPSPHNAKSMRKTIFTHPVLSRVTHQCHKTPFSTIYPVQRPIRS